LKFGAAERAGGAPPTFGAAQPSAPASNYNFGGAVKQPFGPCTASGLSFGAGGSQGTLGSGTSSAANTSPVQLLPQGFSLKGRGAAGGVATPTFGAAPAFGTPGTSQAHNFGAPGGGASIPTFGGSSGLGFSFGGVSNTGAPPSLLGGGMPSLCTSTFQDRKIKMLQRRKR
jgi:hypothetical protein